MLRRPLHENGEPLQKEPTELRILPINLQIGDRIPTRRVSMRSSVARTRRTRRKDVNVRVKRIDNAEITMIRSWSALERVTVKRG
jgi:hypothetical protein